MDNLCLDGAALTVQKVSSGKVNNATQLDCGAQDGWDGKTIEVREIKTSSTDDAIQLFFESKRRSGGDTVDKVQRDTDNYVTYVTFEMPEVAERVLAMDNLCLDGALLTIVKATRRQHLPVSGEGKPGLEAGEWFEEPHHTDKFMSARATEVSTTQPSATAGRTILVRGIKATTKEEVLRLFFQNKRRSHGGPVDSVVYTRSKGEATITFQKREDAQSVLQVGRLSLEDSYLSVTDVNVKENKQRIVRHATTISAGNDNSSVRIVEITGIKPGTHKDVIEMFIENKSGGSELESCDFDETSGVAVVAFMNASGAAKLWNAHPLELSDARLSITPLNDVYEGLDRESCRSKAVNVCGLPSGVTEEYLRLFFENRRSGGGDIDVLEYNADEDVAIITFKEADSANRVAQKELQVVKDVQVEVHLMKPVMYMSEVPGPFEDDVFLLSGLSPKCTSEDVKAFFSTPDLDSEIEQVIFPQQPGIAVLQFSHRAPDFDSLRVTCITKPLRNKMVIIQRMTQSRKIQVHDIGDVAEDVLRLYFENKRSGGSEVVDIHIIQEEDCALVEVPDNATVRSILAVRNHKVESQSLHVTAFYDSVGLIPPNHDTTRPGGWIPKNVTVTGLNAQLLSFISTSSIGRKLVDDKMAGIEAAVDWDTYSDTAGSIDLTCTISHTMNNAQHLAKTWKQDAPKIFREVLNNEFASEEVDILQQAWDKFKERIAYVEEQDHDKVVVDVVPTTCVVRVIGLRNEVEYVYARLQRDQSLVQEEMTRAANVVTEVRPNMELHQLRMLIAKAFKSEQETNSPDMKIVIDMKSFEVKFTGVPSDVQSAKHAMYDILNNTTCQSVKMSRSLICIINCAAMRKHLVEQFKTKHICAVFDKDEESEKLMVYALSERDVGVAVETIKNETNETRVAADLVSLSASEKWNELMTKLESDHMGLLAIVECDDCVTLSGAFEPVKVATHEVQHFLDENIITEQSVQLENGLIVYMETFMKEDVDSIRRSFPRVTVTVSSDEVCGFAVVGNKDDGLAATQQLQKLADDVAFDELVVDKPGMSKFLHSPAGKHSLKDVQSENKVLILEVGKSPLRGAEGGRSTRRSDDGDALSRGEGGQSGSYVVLPGGAIIEVVRGDLTMFQADAIVNAATRHLDNRGGLAKAITDAGGPDIERECRNHVKRHGGLRTGQVFVSTSGRLPCKKVIHAVGPKWQDGHHNEDDELYKVIYESMKTAETLKVSSVAFPAVSCGRSSYPLDEATKTIVTAVKDFLEDKHTKYVTKVSLVDRSDDIVREFRSSVGYVCGSSPKQDISNKTGAWAKLGNIAKSVTSFFGGTDDQTLHSPTPSSKKAPGPASSQLTTPEGIALSLRKSELAHEKVDAIVNSANRKLQLDQGFVSRALLHRGGQTLQQECQQNAPNGVEAGGVVVTSGGKLSCKFVIHGACSRWDGGAGRSEQVLRKFVNNCFQEADNNKVTSIAIPPIGVGKLGFDPRFVASVMREEAFDFSRRNPQTSLKEVRFVVYQKDSSTIQAFEELFEEPFPSEVRETSVPERPRKLASTRPMQDEELDLSGFVGGTPKKSQWITLNIYAMSSSVISHSKRAIEQLCEKHCKEVVLNSDEDQSTIGKLNKEEIKEIMTLEETFDVKVIIDTKRRKPLIRVQGRTEDISQAQAKISDIFRRVEVDDVKKSQASVIAAMVHWSHDDQGKFVDYPDEINSVLEKAYQAKKDKIEWKEVDDVTYRVDFTNMVETTRANHVGIAVKRSTVDSELPSNWTRMNDGEDARLEDVQKQSAEYTKVEKEFMNTAGTMVKLITKIERVQNPSLYRLYLLRRKDMEKRINQPKLIERSLWHGTSADVVDNINTAGFNRSYCGKNATFFGKGVYFAVNTSYPAGQGYAAPDSSGHKRIYKTLVLAGDYTKGVKDMPVPPQNPNNPGFPYDSTVDDMSNPTMFVVFLDNMVYPEYLITFT